MKLKLLLLLLAFQVVHFLPAQEFPLKWTYCYISFIFNEPGWEGPFLWEVGRWSTFEDENGNTCTYLDIDSYLPMQICREGDKIYYSNEEGYHPLYDFGKGLGDTLMVSTAFDNLGGAVDTFYFEITAVDSVYWNGDYLKVQHISRIGSLSGYIWGDRIIENMGNDKFFTPLFSGLEVDPELISVTFDGTYFNNAACILTDTDEVDVGDLKALVKPNPFLDQLDIDAQQLLANTNEDFYFTISNLQGQLLIEGPLQSGLTIATEWWPKGLYVLQIKTANGNHVFAQKLVKG